jgi:hypothetical protein
VDERPGWNATVIDGRRRVLLIAAGPRIDTRLLAALERLDDHDVPIAETHRRLAHVARRLRLFRPSYEQVRRLVHLARRKGRTPSAGDVLLGIAFNVRPPTDLMDYLLDTLPPRSRGP